MKRRGTVTVTMYEFSNTFELIHQRISIADAPALNIENHRLGEKTAVHDAIVWAIDETANQIGTPPESDHLDTVNVAVLTDGKENASKTPHTVVRDRINHRQGGLNFYLFTVIRTLR